MKTVLWKKIRTIAITLVLVLGVVGAGALVTASPAQASISTCNGRNYLGVPWGWEVRCFGNPGTEPNQFRAKVLCPVEGWKYGPWRYVDPTDPDWSLAMCANGYSYLAKGYQTG